MMKPLSTGLVYIGHSFTHPIPKSSSGADNGSRDRPGSPFNYDVRDGKSQSWDGD